MTRRTDSAFGGAALASITLALATGSPAGAHDVPAPAQMRADLEPAPKAPSPTPSRVVLNPTETSGTSHAVTWRTDAATATGAVEIGPAGGGDTVTAPRGRRAALLRRLGVRVAPPLRGDHGLEPGTAYRYRVGGDGLEPVERVHHPGTRGSDAWSMLYFGDAQNDLRAKWTPVVQRAFATVPDVELHLHAGDLINTASNDDEWQAWFDALGRPRRRARDVRHAWQPRAVRRPDADAVQRALHPPRQRAAEPQAVGLLHRLRRRAVRVAGLEHVLGQPARRARAGRLARAGARVEPQPLVGGDVPPPALLRLGGPRQPAPADGLAAGSSRAQRRPRAPGPRPHVRARARGRQRDADRKEHGAGLRGVGVGAEVLRAPARRREQLDPQRCAARRGVRADLDVPADPCGGRPAALPLDHRGEGPGDDRDGGSARPSTRSRSRKGADGTKLVTEGAEFPAP